MSSTSSPVHKAFGISAKEHGESEWKPNTDYNLEVIGLGLSRTGTTSLRAALAMLGFGPVHHGVELIRRPTHNATMISFLHHLNTHPETRLNPSPEIQSRLRNLMIGYRSSVDAPISDLIPELLSTYPNAKYILSLRDTPSQWYTSWNSAIGIHFHTSQLRYKIYRLLISSVKWLRLMDEVAQEMNTRLRQDWGGEIGPQIYERHNDLVVRLVPKERLLVWNVKEGWEPLCRFLEVEVPDGPFPMLNDGGSMKALYFGLQVYGACCWSLYFGAVGVAVYLVVNPSKAQALFNTFLKVLSYAV